MGGKLPPLSGAEGTGPPIRLFGYPVAQLGGPLSGGEIANPTGAGRPGATVRSLRKLSFGWRIRTSFGKAPCYLRVRCSPGLTLCNPTRCQENPPRPQRHLIRVWRLVTSTKLNRGNRPIESCLKS